MVITLVAGTWYFAQQMFGLRTDIRDIHADVNEQGAVLSLRMQHVEVTLGELKDRIKALEAQK